MIRVVVDTNIVVSAALVPRGSPAAVMDLIFAGDLVPCVSPAILAEYDEVLERLHIRIDGERAKGLRETIRRIAILVKPSTALSVCSDPDDNKFVECAL